MWALRWLCLAVLWLALADSRAWQELVAAGVVATVGAFLAGAIRRPGGPRTIRSLATLARRSPGTLLRPLWRLVVDTGILVGGLWRRLARRQRISGSFRAAPHRPPTAARSAAARAVAEIWNSVTPNRYVVGIDDDRGIILVHELIPSDEPIDPLAPR
jgi:multisubunit Na+/H+ antiporter MnhE subunit